MFADRFEVCQTGGLGRRLAQHFCGFFSSSKSAPANRKKAFYTSRLPKNEESRGIYVYEAAKNFELFLKIQNQSLKI
jgi:hypothetical protein